MSYAQAMDGLILKGPFKYLLDCRDQLKADPLFQYSLRFLKENEGQTMFVNRARRYEGLMARVSIELSVNLKSSPQKIFFTYLHELTHVCQAYRWADLQAKFDIIESLPQNFVGGMGMHPDVYRGSDCTGGMAAPLFLQGSFRSEIKADFHRHRKLGEVEAFYNMTRAYQHYTASDPSFCHGTKDDGDSNMNEGYLEMERMINEGYFAQDIIMKYHESDSSKEEEAAALFDLSSPQKLYPDQVLRPALSPAMRDLIKKAGMPLREPAPLGSGFD